MDLHFDLDLENLSKEVTTFFQNTNLFELPEGSLPMVGESLNDLMPNWMKPKTSTERGGYRRSYDYRHDFVDHHTDDHGVYDYGCYDPDYYYDDGHNDNYYDQWHDDSNFDDNSYYYYDPMDNDFYNDQNNTYENPYYNVGDGVLSDIGEWLATLDWTSVLFWSLVTLAYMVLSTIGFFLFAPLISCLWMTSGDLNTCSLGIWGNAYKDSNSLCANRQWALEISDEQARCYRDRYYDVPQDDCKAKIHFDETGLLEGRDPNCY